MILRARRQFLTGALTHRAPPVPDVLLLPDTAQQRHSGDAGQPGRSAVPVGFGSHRVQQSEAIGADGDGERSPLGLALGQPPVVGAGPVTPHPGLGYQVVLGEPAGSSDRRGFQRRPQRLGDELQPVQRPHAGHHVRGIGADPAADSSPSSAHRSSINSSTRASTPLSIKRSEELRQHTVIEPRVCRLEAQGVFPVDPGRRGVRCLPIGQPLRILQHADQHQRRRRQRRPAPAGIGVREVGVA